MITSPSLSLPEPNWPARSGVVPSLDGLRGVSILLVLLGHVVLPAPLVGVSALGLKIFFFLSGLLITRMLLAENKAAGAISLRNFYLRRVLRLYPVIIVYVLLVTTVALARGVEVRKIDVAAVFFYFVNYLVVYYQRLGLDNSLPVSMMWSLSVEEHFYLLAPLALVAVRGHAKKMLVVAIGICIGCLALRLFRAWLEPGIVQTLELYWRSETRFDCIAFGVVLACLTEFPAGRSIVRRLSSRHAFAAGFVFLLATYAYRDAYYQNTWRFTLQGMALIPIVCAVVFAQPMPLLNRVLNATWLVRIGALSYSLYIWHAGVMFLFGQWLGQLPRPALVTSELLIAFILASLSYRFVELPMMSLRRRFGHGARRDQAKTAGRFKAQT